MADATEAVLRRRRRLRRLDRAVIAALVLLMSTLALWPSVFVRIGTGEVGVLYRLLGGGTETDFVYHEGLVMKLPWDEIILYQRQTHAVSQEVVALTNDGLPVTFEITTLYHPDVEKAGFIHRDIGPDFVNRVVLPASNQAIRRAVGLHPSRDLYSPAVSKVSAEAVADLQSLTAPYWIVIENLLIHRIELPPAIDSAVDAKLRQEQIAASYAFRIPLAKAEAARRRIAGIGQRIFYSILAESLTPQTLAWQGIKASVALARSPNTKVVVAGSSDAAASLIISSGPIVATPPQEAQQGGTVGAWMDNRLPDFDGLPSIAPSDLGNPQLGGIADMATDWLTPGSTVAIP